MYVYADILVLTNFLVDYFLLRLSAIFLHKRTKLWRMILSAFVGGLFSLYIFLPKTNFLLQIIIHVLMSASLVGLAFGWGSVKDFCRNTAVLLAVNFAYSGCMIAIRYVFNPYGMVINNSVVYFNVSPIFLIVFTVVGYFAVSLSKRLLQKTFPQNIHCSATLFCFEKILTLDAIADTGNSLKDVFGISQIFITDAQTVDCLLPYDKSSDRVRCRYRAVPCSTVSGSTVLNGYRIDRAEVIKNGKKYVFFDE